MMILNSSKTNFIEDFIRFSVGDSISWYIRRFEKGETIIAQDLWMYEEKNYPACLLKTVMLKLDWTVSII